MHLTIFDIPVLRDVLRGLALLILKVCGWRREGNLPDIPKYVMIAAPHTSNWDFLLFLGLIFTLRANVNFMGKAELFRNPFGWFFYYCGGVPVDRKKPTGLVEQMVEACNKSDRFILTIAPEGTRHQVQQWKRGFYHIAKNSGIPIVMAVAIAIVSLVRPFPRPLGATSLAASGHVNLSPKGLDSLAILSPREVAYLDLVGSGAETIAHLRENGRITFMFCAFASR